MRKNFGAKPYLYPQPVMIIGTYDENGNANAMNAAWGGMAGANKIMIDLSSHKTTDNIQLNRAFTVSVGDVKHLTACDYVGMVSAHNAPDKMEKAGFTTTKSDFVNAPIINELPLTLECELLDVIEGSLYLGEIKNVSMQALGVDIQTIQSIVGHADTEMTEHYLHVQESIRQSAIQLFSEAFSA